MELTWNEVRELILITVAVFVFWQTNKSFPAEKTGELIEKLTVASKKTETQIDDILVLIAEALNDLRNKTSDDTGSADLTSSD